MSGHPIMEKGILKGYFGVIKDITDRKLLEEKYRSIFDNAVEGIYQSTLDGGFLTVNRALVKMLGYEDEGELLAVRITQELYVDPSDRERFLSLLKSEGKAIAYGTRLRRKDGTELVVQDSARLVSGKGREKPIVEGFLENVTAEVQLAEDLRKVNAELETRNRELKEADRLKDEFLANMSHELRTPLNSIIGFSEVLRDGLAGPVTDEQRKFISLINEGGTHLLTLINDVLDLAKIEAGEVSLDLEVVDLPAICSELVESFRPQFEAKRIILIKEMPETIPEIVGDKFKLKQVFLNLISNACAFTPNGGTVTLRAETVNAVDYLPQLQENVAAPNGEAILVTVRDTGIGINKEHHEAIFDKFRQVDGSRRRGHDGTGLGLPIARRLIELHAGCIWVESEPGNGAIFSVLLPLSAGKSSNNEKSAQPADSDRHSLREAVT